MERPWTDRGREVNQKPLRQLRTISGLEYETENMALQYFNISKATFRRILNSRGDVTLRTVRLRKIWLFCVRDLNSIIVPALKECKFKVVKKQC
jgi:hypothetical protein